jgi:hypothetical protein
MGGGKDPAPGGIGKGPMDIAVAEDAIDGIRDGWARKSLSFEEHAMLSELIAGVEEA